MPPEDITEILKTWPHDFGTLNVRIIEADNGRELLQLRIELGVVQMEMEGRPDGIMQEGYDSLLSMLEGQGCKEGIKPDLCRRLREEGVQRSHRAAALFAISRWEAVISDCEKNLTLFDLCKFNAQEDQDKEALEQFRAAVIAMRARSAAEWAIEKENLNEAMAALDQGLNSLEESLGNNWEEANESQLLSGMKESLVPKLPTSERADLQHRLEAAIENENYELAAILRDELRLLRD